MTAPSCSALEAAPQMAAPARESGDEPQSAPSPTAEPSAYGSGSITPPLATPALSWKQEVKPPVTPVVSDLQLCLSPKVMARPLLGKGHFETSPQARPLTPNPAITAPSDRFGRRSAGLTSGKRTAGLTFRCGNCWSEVGPAQNSRRKDTPDSPRPGSPHSKKLIPLPLQLSVICRPASAQK